MATTRFAFTLVNGDTLSIYLRGQMFSVDSSNPHFGKLLTECKRKKPDIKVITKLVDVATALPKFTKGAACVKNGEVFYNGEPLHDSLAQRIIGLMQSRKPYTPFVRLLNNIRTNPSMWAVQTAYDFLKSKEMPITNDGCFIGYKSIRSDWTDWYSGKFVNKVGTTLKVPRNTVDDNRQQACSYGFHVGNLTYVKGFHWNEGRTILVKVNPQDIVSVPSDAAQDKIRVCKYKVVAEYNPDKPLRMALYKHS